MSKKLVAYFSAQGTTAAIAKQLASLIDADLHEIIPTKRYTKADLDWTNTKSRSILEMENKSYRPSIENRVMDLQKYEVIFIGFPIWDYTVPTIILTFLEKYDWSGKTVVPFATSRLTGIDIANGTLRNVCAGANFIDGKRFAKHVSADELRDWAEGVLYNKTSFYEEFFKEI